MNLEFFISGCCVFISCQLRPGDGVENEASAWGVLSIEVSLRSLTFEDTNDKTLNQYV